MATPKLEQTVILARTSTQDQDDLDLAFEIIKDAIKKGHSFTNEQKDLGVKLSINAMNEEQQLFLAEAAAARDVPLWMAIYAQWYRAREWGVVFDLIMPPEWEELKG